MSFSQLSILFVTAGLFAVVTRALKQPLIVGYLLAGVFLSASGMIQDPVLLGSLSKVGVAMLLFLLGLEVRISEFWTIGKHAFYIGIGQIIVTAFVATAICIFLGFSLPQSFLISLAITFSSTIVLVRLLSEKKDIASLYGRIAIGIMLVQDIIAVMVLMFLTSSGGDASSMLYLSIPIKMLLLVVVVIFLSKTIIPKIFERLTFGSPELMFILSIAWALGFSSFVENSIGLSLEVGGYLAGIALSNISENLQISSRTRPIKDFFLILFFLNLGFVFVLDRGIISRTLVPAGILSLFVLLGSPLIVMSMMRPLGYRARTSFLTGVSVAQISEFSLILAVEAEAIGLLSREAVSVIVLVGIITMVVSTYAIINSEKLYQAVSRYLRIFERGGVRERVLIKKVPLTNHIVLVGCHRTGSVLMNYFIRKKMYFVVVDFDPQVYSRVSANGAEAILGDISDSEVFDAANSSSASAIVSTISKVEDDLFILEQLRHLEKKPLTIFTASQAKDAIFLYEKGADMVILPEILTGEYIKSIFRKGLDKDVIVKLGKQHFERIMANAAFR